MKRRVIFIATVLVLAVVGISGQGFQRNNTPFSFEAGADQFITTVVINDKVFVVETAKTAEEKAQGLSGRKQMSAESGMIFVFDSPTIPTFWMREMKFGLDFVWINENLEVIDITRNVPPPDPTTPLSELKRYSPKSEIKYALEINAGQAEGISIGDRVLLQYTDNL